MVTRTLLEQCIRDAERLVLRLWIARRYLEREPSQYASWLLDEAVGLLHQAEFVRSEFLHAVSYLGSGGSRTSRQLMRHVRVHFRSLHHLVWRVEAFCHWVVVTARISLSD